MGSESRKLEYKECLPWKALRLKITKAALAMANLEDGGRIMVGVKEVGDAKKPTPVGLSEEDTNTYDKDTVTEFLNEYADPYIDADVDVFPYGAKHFVVISVSEFADVPVICKKGSKGITRGQMYVRPRRKAESVPVPTAAEFREVLDRAIDKGILRQLGRLKSYERGREGVPEGERKS